MYIPTRNESTDTMRFDDITGVVLIGGESKRMGAPKALIPWNGIPMFERTGQLLQKHFAKVVLSHKSQRFDLPETTFPVIEDTQQQNGPMSGLLAVLETLQQAVFILPCDMPYITSDEILSVIKRRNPDEFCTVYYRESHAYYEPLVGIWEFSSLSILKKSIQEGQYSFQKLLREHGITKNNIESEQPFTNFNYPGDI